MREFSCSTCHWGDWSLPDTQCKKCVAFNKWEPKQPKPSKPEPAEKYRDQNDNS